MSARQGRLSFLYIYRESHRSKTAVAFTFYLSERQLARSAKSRRVSALSPDPGGKSADRYCSLDLFFCKIQILCVFQSIYQSFSSLIKRSPYDPKHQPGIFHIHRRFFILERRITALPTLGLGIKQFGRHISHDIRTGIILDCQRQGSIILACPVLVCILSATSF